MRFKLGLIVGAGVGYLVATRSGREHIEQIERAISRVRTSDGLGTAVDKAKAAVDLGVERARRGVDDQLVRHASAATYEPGHPSLN
jgi:hypothetical protein